MDIEQVKARCTVDNNGCWNWTGAKASGYGRIKRNKVVLSVHRIAFQSSHPGVQMDGMDVCHHCDNRACCNPEHLFLGTRQDNMIDCSNKKRLAAQNGKHVAPKYDESWIPVVVNLRRQGLSKRRVARVLGWDYTTLRRYERRHQICY